METMILPRRRKRGKCERGGLWHTNPVLQRNRVVAWQQQTLRKTTSWAAILKQTELLMEKRQEGLYQYLQKERAIVEGTMARPNRIRT
ncbi:hypothetical protein [Pseudoxanthomonas sp. UTMC 1351]|uniref:hypothetical protein n=1 Tax=Pseudoxanthomonas sp. UTMC 1351 TaxID=2695853 RepID=UPI0034CD8529